MVPHTLIVSPDLRIEKVYVGYWFWGRPSPEQLWLDPQHVARRLKPDYDPTIPEAREVAFPAVVAGAKPTRAGRSRGAGTRGVDHRRAMA